MANRPAVIRKSDLAPAFEAAKAAGFEHVSVTVETADGQIIHISAGTSPEASTAEMTPLKKWRAGRAS